MVTLSLAANVKVQTGAATIYTDGDFYYPLTIDIPLVTQEGELIDATEGAQGSYNTFGVKVRDDKGVPVLVPNRVVPIPNYDFSVPGKLTLKFPRQGIPGIPTGTWPYRVLILDNSSNMRLIAVINLTVAAP